ncbi:MAG TPA: hypothetical protein VNY09_08140 [Candidatus Sulfotelmatobacter sp.]|nr:hypothetical protein [Candidatus Sulfotelmatobacter sp.]
MTNSIHSVQSAQAQTQTEQAVQPPKNLQAEAAKRNAAPHDQVTISQEARHALATNTK